MLIAVLLNKRTRREDAIFLLTGYVVMLISFAAFVIVYPYTCSSDFRYVAICLVYVSIALGLGSKYYLLPFSGGTSSKALRIKSACMNAINGGILLFLTFITVIYLFWERW